MIDRSGHLMLLSNLIDQSYHILIVFTNPQNLGWDFLTIQLSKIGLLRDM